jgi:hypothetical protein
MPPLSLVMIVFAIIGLDMASAHTDTCSDEIGQLEELVESMGNPMAKPSLPQSIDAQLLTNQHANQFGGSRKMHGCDLRRSWRVPKS